MLLSGLLILTSLFQTHEQPEFSMGVNYSSYLLFQDTTEAIGKWNLDGEIGVINVVPHAGLKFRGSKLRYEAPVEQGPYVWEYTPLSLCASFNVLPFLRIPWLRLSLETGIGLYLWRGLYDGEVIILPTGDKMEETDIGFVGGVTLQIRPVRNLGIEYVMRYNYIASTDIYKYGFYDKDDKIWENGIGVKFILPL
ncbi:hypothetical protein IBX73_09095 [candidate division WOR-3 bacterium]|nr:hypothetical protein [candidate division WOR-3 bacterium]